MAQDKRVAIYPGTFDPLTNGHANIIRRGLRMFDNIIVAVAADTGKSPLFSLEERVAMAEKVFAKEPNISVEPFQGLLVEYVARRNVHTVLRGLRAVSDFEYEFQIALMNRKLRPDIETLFLISDYRWLYISSTIVKTSQVWAEMCAGLSLTMFSAACASASDSRTERSNPYRCRPYRNSRNLRAYRNWKRHSTGILINDETTRRLSCRPYGRWKIRDRFTPCRAVQRRDHQCGFASGF